MITIINDTLDKIRRKEASVNEILKHTRYDWLNNSDDLSNRERDRLMSVKSDLRTSHAYHFKIALQRLWKVNVSITKSYLKKWILWGAIKSGINSTVVEGLNNKIRTAFKRSYGFKASGLQGHDHISCGRRIEITPRMLK